ncbi:MAG: PLP-dependent aminotransferase family protein [Bacteroidaceae bacterium]|nr:PLP-dependent aminotransferase family protein [Bacteroidaceae bacterium]
MLRPWSFDIQIDTADRSVPLYMQVANTIQAIIDRGGLRPGDALPGSREMAEHLDVSRKTVVSAISYLLRKGSIVNKPRIGMFVAEPPVIPDSSAEPAPRTLLTIDDGLPDTTIVPFAELSRAYRQLFNRAARWQMLGYTQPYGHQRFREAVAKMLNLSRSLTVSPDNICITRGSQMALYLISHALLQPGDTIIMENPGYPRAYDTFLQAGLKIIPVDVDEHGIIVDDIEQIMRHTCINAIYLTPRHQFPTTVTLSARRRQQLVRLVRMYQFYVVEDDYGCEFHFSGPLLSPLYTQLPPDYAIYIGSFSKLLAPAIRIGMMAASEAAIRKVGELRSLIDMQGDNSMEQAILDLIEQGALRRHLKESTKLYVRKKNHLCKLLATLGDKVRFCNPTGGLAVWVTLPQLRITAGDLTARLAKNYVAAPVFTLPTGEVGIRIGYASLSYTDIEKLVSILGTTV